MGLLKTNSMAIEVGKILAVIPARGGSKGIPGKNIIELAGKPLLAWSIEAVLDSQIVDKVLVSTDDHNIAKMAKKFGAEVPFLRPQSLSEDQSASIDVVLHAVDFLEQSGEVYDIVIMVEPTSPLRTGNDIVNAIRDLKSSDFSSIVSVVKIESCHPAFLYKMQDNNGITPLTGKQPNNVRRQDISPLLL